MRKLLVMKEAEGWAVKDGELGSFRQRLVALSVTAEDHFLRRTSVH